MHEHEEERVAAVSAPREVLGRLDDPPDQEADTFARLTERLGELDRRIAEIERSLGVTDRGSCR
ncbi:MAG TPA: hypothetical protein VNL16_06135 [Chloroflexota bacterium]|nr:hypothetical protein [Chloroflexota bacterium]HVC33072.1 hypothetical protein [Chloroflexota bacterium]